MPPPGAVLAHITGGQPPWPAPHPSVGPGPELRRWWPFIGVTGALVVTVALLLVVLLATGDREPGPTAVPATTADRNSSAVPATAPRPDTDRPADQTASVARGTSAPGPSVEVAPPTASRARIDDREDEPATATAEPTVSQPGAPPSVATTGDDAARGIALDTRFAGSGNDEWIRITNTGTDVVDLSGWSLSDDGLRHRYLFGDVRLAPADTVTVFSGCGDDDSAAVFWCAPGDVWDDAGDVATLVDGDGRLVSTTGRS